ncbi:MAG: ComEC/Rec2 family competence protein [Candidatus Krumholzibacteriales bacterium]
MVKWWAFFYLAGNLARFDNNCFLELQAAAFVLYFISINRKGKGLDYSLAGNLFFGRGELFLLTSATSIILYSSSAALSAFPDAGLSIPSVGTMHGATGALLSKAALAREYLERKMTGGCLTRLSSALGKAMLLADKSSLPAGLRDDYLYLGLAHFLALSGLHLGIVILPLSHLLSLTGLNRWAGGLIISLLATAYCAITGFPPSLIRAASLVIAVFFLRSLNTRANLTESLITAGLATALITPRIINSAGFQLSFTAVAGISAIGLPAIRYLKKYSGTRRRFRVIGIVVSPVIITIAVNLFILPILLKEYGRCALVSPLANLAMIIPFTVFLYSGMVYLIAPFDIIREPVSVSANSSATLLRWIPRRISSHHYPCIMSGDIQPVIYSAAVCLLGIALSRRTGHRTKIAGAALIIGVLSFVYPRVASNQIGNSYIYTDFGDPAWAGSFRYSSAAGGIITIRSGINAYQAAGVIRRLYGENIGKVSTMIICSSELNSIQGISNLSGWLGVKRIVCSKYLRQGSAGLLPEIKGSVEIISVKKGNRIRFQNIELQILNPDFPPPGGSVLDSARAYLRYNMIIHK